MMTMMMDLPWSAVTSAFSINANNLNTFKNRLHDSEPTMN